MEAEKILQDELQISALGEVWEMLACVHAAWGGKVLAEAAAGRALDFYQITNGKDIAQSSLLAKWYRDARLCEFWQVNIRVSVALTLEGLMLMYRIERNAS